MTRSVLMWAVCHQSRRGRWEPLVSTLATTRKAAVARYAGNSDTGAELFRRFCKAGRLRAMRVEVTPIEPVAPHAP